MTRPRALALPLAIATLCAIAGAALAQEWRGPVSIEATVEDSRGKDIAGAEVRLVYLSPSGGLLPSMLTDAGGKIAVGGLAAGRWMIEVRHAGHMTYRAEVALSADSKPAVLSAAQEMSPGATGTMRVKLSKGKGDAPVPRDVVTAQPPPSPARAPQSRAPQAPAPSTVSSAPPVASAPAPKPAPTPAVATAPRPEQAEAKPAATTPAASPSPPATGGVSGAVPPAVPPAKPAAPTVATPTPPAPKPAVTPAPVSPPGVTGTPSPAPVVPPAAPAASKPATAPASAPPTASAAPQTPASPPAPAATAPAVSGAPTAAPPATKPPATPAVTEPVAKAPAATAPAPATSPETTPPNPPVAAPPPKPTPAPTSAPAAAPAPAPPVAAAPAPAPAVVTAPTPSPAVVAPASEAPPVSAPATAAAAAAVPRAASPSAPTQPAAPGRQRVCVECAPGENATWGEALIAGGASGGCPADLRQRFETVSLIGDVAFDALAASLGPGCRAIRIDLPYGARFTGFRYEATGGAVTADCLPGRDCPAGGARFPLEPVIRREAARVTLLVGFESTAPDARTAIVAGYSSFARK